MNKKILLVGLCICLVLLVGCGGPDFPYDDGSCGSLCVQQECRKAEAKCEWYSYALSFDNGELSSPSLEIIEYCANFCYDTDNTTNKDNFKTLEI